MAGFPQEVLTICLFAGKVGRQLITKKEEPNWLLFLHVRQMLRITFPCRPFQAFPCRPFQAFRPCLGRLFSLDVRQPWLLL